MFEHEIDSDDDFEGYFLQPVNAYNIVDKIKEANSELSAIPNPESPSITGVHRKVKFREVLEDYEPQNNEPLVLESDVSSNEESTENFSEQAEQKMVPIIDEEEEEEEEKYRSEEIVLDKMMSSDTSENEIEEICEEVANLDILTENSSEIHASLSTLDSEKNSPVKNVIDLNPVMAQLSEQSTDELSTYSKTSDDELSVIVACYPKEIPKITIENEEKPKSANRSRSRPFGGVKPRGKSTQQRVTDMLKLRLNYKTCCEYKSAIEENLPKYNGYYSQYGLSKEQWDMRDKRIENGRKKHVERASKAKEDEVRKGNDNEQAFTSWLKNKMRFPINKTKNMFDLKPTKSKKNKI